MKVLLSIWELPQTLVALCCLLYLHLKKADLQKDGCIYRGDIFNGVCLGEFIFLDKRDTEDSAKHELGHQKQSRILGPLYLLIVGLPSVLLNITSRIVHKRGKSIDYYSHFPENWADKLGGVTREKH